MIHRLAIRPRFSELDPYNHVNHAVYVSWFEAGRVEALESVGLSLQDLAVQGMQVVVAEITVRYRGSAGAGDDLVIETSVGEIRGASSTWRQRLVRAGSPGREVLCECEVRAGTCDLTGRPVRSGDAVRNGIQRLAVSQADWETSPR